MRQRIIACIAQTFDIDASEVGDRLDLLEAWDSLSHLRMILDLETLLDIQFTLEEIVSISTISDIVRLAKEKADDNPI